jgi:hypothetical protein
LAEPDKYIDFAISVAVFMWHGLKGVSSKFVSGQNNRCHSVKLCQSVTHVKGVTLVKK